MARYVLHNFQQYIPLPTGGVAVRVVCPSCKSLHPDLQPGNESLCYGCGNILTVWGAELLTAETPNGWFDDVEGDDFSGDDPDFPSFWYYLDS
jgi:hypothetical protein